MILISECCLPLILKLKEKYVLHHSTQQHILGSMLGHSLICSAAISNAEGSCGLRYVILPSFHEPESAS